MRDRVLVATTLVFAAVFATAVMMTSSASQAASLTPDASTSPGATASVEDGVVARGKDLYAQSCAACHGDLGEGIDDRGPSLVGVGSAAVDFMLSTGRMPLDHPGEEPVRSDPAFSPSDMRAITAFVATLGAGGPRIPTVSPAQGDLRRGRAIFAESCSGCHQIVGEGGIGPGFQAPALSRATPTQISEAIRVGPYLMPKFTTAQLSEHDIDSVARFVTTAARKPDDRGGWGIGHIGPIPEGLVALLLGGGAILVITRVIGEGRR